MLDQKVLDAAIKERVIFVIGQKDTGKTTIVKELAKELFLRGYSVGVIDTDVGQSDIGPPTTVGLGTVEAVLEHLEDAVLQAFYFVGSTSPKGNLLSVIIGTCKMLDKAFSLGLQKILIDTTGLVSGQFGRVLKEYKIAVVHPDVIVCLQAEDECEHILRGYEAFAKPRIFRLTPDNQCRKRTMKERRNYREAAFRKYFAHARDIGCPLVGIGILGTAMFSGYPLLKLKQCWANIAHVKSYRVDEFENILVGILNKNGDFCGLGILRSIDFSSCQAIIHTSVDQKEIAGLKLSKYVMHDV